MTSSTTSRSSNSATANPDTNTNQLHGSDFVRLLRFVRLWKKLGWTIEQTDQTLSALYPVGDLPTGADEAADLQHLDSGFLASCHGSACCAR